MFCEDLSKINYKDFLCLSGGKIRKGNILFVMLPRAGHNNTFIIFRKYIEKNCKIRHFLHYFWFCLETLSLFLFEVLMNQVRAESSEVCPRKFLSQPSPSRQQPAPSQCQNRTRTLEVVQSSELFLNQHLLQFKHDLANLLLWTATYCMAWW